MVQVTVLRFRVSNKASTTYDDDCKTSWYKQEIKQLSSAKQITETLNEFMRGRKLIDFQVTPITCKQNNDRDRDDTVDVLYTIFWEPDENFEMAEKERQYAYTALEESLDKIEEKADIHKESLNNTKDSYIRQGNMGYGMPPTKMPQNRWQGNNQVIQQNPYPTNPFPTYNN